jgi:hypothetical protein
MLLELQGVTTQCALVSDFTTGRGYGTTECQSCNTQAVCLINHMVGKCSCLQQGMQLQKCTLSDVGATMMTSSIALCGVTFTASSARSMLPYLPWHAMATAPCAVVNKGNAQCYRTDIKGYVVVGHGVVHGRRLLHDENTEEVWNIQSEISIFDSWNHTAEPCRTLANAYNTATKLSVTEMLHLESCVHAR